MPLFETKSKMRMISTHKRVTALKFGTAVALVENNMELSRNGGGTAAPAKDRRNIFLPFLAIIDNFQSSEKIFFYKNFPYIFT